MAPVTRTALLETLRYLGNGAICAGANMVVLIGGNRLGFGHFVLVLATWVVGGTLGYVLHARLTFREGLSGMAYARFMAGVALGIPATWLLLELFAGWLRWPMEVAAPAVTIAMLVYNYANARIAILWRRWWRVERGT